MPHLLCVCLCSWIISNQVVCQCSPMMKQIVLKKIQTCILIFKARENPVDTHVLVNLKVSVQSALMVTHKSTNTHINVCAEYTPCHAFIMCTQTHKFKISGVSDAPGGGQQLLPHSQRLHFWTETLKEGEEERCEVKEWSERAWKPSQTGGRTHSLMT